jgi:hypothetical protein
MQMVRRTTVAVSAVAALALASAAFATPDPAKSVAEAQERSAASGHPVLLKVGTSW